MKSSNFRNVQTPMFLIILCLVFGSAVSFDVDLNINNHTFNTLDFLIPTVRSDNEICRNHSLLYKNELSKFTVWATDMFDASSKFPSGIFFGSLYDTGNFDECVNVKLPSSIGFSGQHCMAHFKITPHDTVIVKKNYETSNDHYENIFNISTWDKIARYSQDESKYIRDEIYFTFCIPSTCTSTDLEKSLSETVEILRETLPFNLNIDVNKRNCQVRNGFNFSNGDIIFMSIVGTFILSGTICTFYHLFTKLESLERFKFRGKLHEILRDFSFSHTIKKMATYTKRDDGIDCIYGLRVISMFCVIMGHRGMFYLASPLSNPQFVESSYKNIAWILLYNGPIIVETFFTISGFLACYLMLQEFEKLNRMPNIGLIYFHRFLRLTPVYAIVLAFYCTIFVQLGEGPFWNERIAVEQERCLESWWANILYINNYVNTDQICMFQSWYLTCDTHFFLLVPVLAYLLWKKPKLGLISLGILTIISVIIPTIMIYIKEEDPLLLLYMKLLRDPTVNHTFKSIYIPSHLRASSYLIGIGTGFLKFKMRQNGFKLPKIVVYFLWTFGIAIIAGIYYIAHFYYLPDFHKDYLFDGLYGAMKNLLWGICMAWVIIAVSEGYGAWAAPFLTWSPFVVLSRISFNAFLTHGAIQLYSTATLRGQIHTGFFVLASYTASDIVLSYYVGFLITLVIEAPLITIEKHILRRKSNNEKTVDEKMPQICITKKETWEKRRLSS